MSGDLDNCTELLPSTQNMCKHLVFVASYLSSEYEVNFPVKLNTMSINAIIYNGKPCFAVFYKKSELIIPICPNCKAVQHVPYVHCHLSTMDGSE